MSSTKRRKVTSAKDTTGAKDGKEVEDTKQIKITAKPNDIFLKLDELFAEYSARPSEHMSERFMDTISTMQLTDEQLEQALSKIETFMLRMETMKTSQQHMMEMIQYSVKANQGLKAYIHAIIQGDNLTPYHHLGYPDIATLLDQLINLQQFMTVSEAVFQPFATLFSRRKLELEEMYEIIHPPSTAPKWDKSLLLFHCCRDLSSIQCILRTGLRPGTVGRLGPAIYLADCIEKSLGYGQRKSLSENSYGVVLGIQTFIGGKKKETKQDIYRLPPDIDVCVANGSLQVKQTIPITYCDGAVSNLATEFEVKSIGSLFTHTEYAIRRPEHTRISFIMIFRQPVTGFQRVHPIISNPATTIERELYQVQKQNEWIGIILNRIRHVEKTQGLDDPACKNLRSLLDVVRSTNIREKLIYLM